MKKVLIVVHDMRVGGVQKSLLSFLQCFAQSAYADQCELHLLIQEPEGTLLQQIPDCIRIVPPSTPLRWLGASMSAGLVCRHFSLTGIFGKIAWIVRKKLGLFPRKLNGSQKLWSCWKGLVPKLAEAYDVVLSYQDGCSNYYAIDKVQASKKVLWMHSEYQKQGYDAAFDEAFFHRADGIVTISESCRACLEMEFPALRDKIRVLENITTMESVLQKADQEVSDAFADDRRFGILSVGRLNSQKGFDIAADAAKCLKDAGRQFQWVVIGDGPEHACLQERINALDISDCFQLLGTRENPYPYMKRCDLVVQPSRIEGKSIVLDEAKMLCKPIVVTNYTTVGASITHGVDGWVVDMTPEAVCEGIVHMMDHPDAAAGFSARLAQQEKGNAQEFEKYMALVMA